MLEVTDRAFAREETRLPRDHVFSGMKRNGYPVIYADPPWIFKTRSPKGQGRSPESHYRTMNVKQIANLPVRDLAAKDCHLFLWITGPWLAAGAQLDVMRGWGFEPSSMAFVWIKLNDHETVERAETWDDVLWKGMGFTTRQNAEYVLLGRKGSPPRASSAIRQVVLSRRREHSRKPDQVRSLIQEYVGAPGIELFARESAEGWDSHGLERTKFDDASL